MKMEITATWLIRFLPELQSECSQQQQVIPPSSKQEFPCGQRSRQFFGYPYWPVTLKQAFCPAAHTTCLSSSTAKSPLLAKQRNSSNAVVKLCSSMRTIITVIVAIGSRVRSDWCQILVEWVFIDEMASRNYLEKGCNAASRLPDDIQRKRIARACRACYRENCGAA